MKKQVILGGILGVLLCLTGCGSKEKLSYEDKDTLVAGNYYIAAMEENGEVHIAYQTEWENYPEIYESDWSGIERLMKNEDVPVGISEQGTFIFPKGYSYEELVAQQQKYLAELPFGANYGAGVSAYIGAAEQSHAWTDLKLVTGSYPGSALGVKKDGTLCQAGIWEITGGIEDILGKRNIKDAAILYSGEKIAVLDEEGTVYTSGLEEVNWTDVVAVEAGRQMIFGLKADGTVVHSEYHFAKDYSTEGMKDIVFLAVGYDSENILDVVYGIRKDGKVVNQYGREVPGFEDMVEIDVSMWEGTLFGKNAAGKLVVGTEADENFKKMVEAFNRE